MIKKEEVKTSPKNIIKNIIKNNNKNNRPKITLTSFFKVPILSFLS